MSFEHRTSTAAGGSDGKHILAGTAVERVHFDVNSRPTVNSGHMPNSQILIWNLLYSTKKDDVSVKVVASCIRRLV